MTFLISSLLEDVIQERDVKSVLSEAKSSYEQDKKDGNIKN